MDAGKIVSRERNSSDAYYFGERRMNEIIHVILLLLIVDVN